MTPMKAYAIKDPKGKILPWYISFRSKETKNCLLREYSTPRPTWKQLFDRGYRCVQVTITEVKP